MWLTRLHMIRVKQRPLANRHNGRGNRVLARLKLINVACAPRLQRPQSHPLEWHSPSAVRADERAYSLVRCAARLSSCDPCEAASLLVDGHS